jgi:hypothetical protein
MKSVPNSIFYIHELSWSFPHFLSIFVAPKMVFWFILSCKSLPCGAHVSVHFRVHDEHGITAAVALSRQPWSEIRYLPRDSIAGLSCWPRPPSAGVRNMPAAELKAAAPWRHSHPTIADAAARASSSVGSATSKHASRAIAAAL